MVSYKPLGVQDDRRVLPLLGNTPREATAHNPQDLKQTIPRNAFLCTDIIVVLVASSMKQFPVLSAQPIAVL